MTVTDVAEHNDAAPPADEEHEPEAQADAAAEAAAPPAETPGTELAAVVEQKMDLALVPERGEMYAVAQLANTYAFSGICPKALQRKPNDCFILFLTARDLGIALTAAPRLIHIIDSTPSLSPKLRIALVNESGKGRMWPAGQNTTETATWRGERFDRPGEVIESTYTWQDAQLANLADGRCTPYKHWRERKNDGKWQTCFCKDNWQHYPGRMLSWRAAGFLADDLFPEVGMGLYSPDELGAITNEDGEPIDVTAVESIPGMKGGQAAPGEAPPVELVAEADAAELARRIEGLRAAPDGLRTFMAWWKDREYPKVPELTPRQAHTALARIAQIEGQYNIKPGEAPTASAEPAPAETAMETPAAPEAGQEGPITDPDDPGYWAHVEPKNLCLLGDVAGWFIEEAQGMNTVDLKTAYTVAGLVPPKGNLAMLRHTWALTRFQGSAVATLYLLSGFAVGTDVVLAAVREVTGGEG